MSRDQRKAAVTKAVDLIGSSSLAGALSKYGIAGGVINSSLPGIPGRDIYSAFAVEEDLRAQYSIAYGTRMPPVGTPIVEMSALELFDDMTVINKDVGIGDLYLLVPGKTNQENPSIIGVSRNSIIDNILPGDRLIVRCGPLSHVAIVYRIEKEIDKIWFVDPLYQYWLPSHNECMTKEDLVDGPYNSFLVVVSLKEVQLSIQAIITKRSDVGARK